MRCHAAGPGRERSHPRQRAQPSLKWTKQQSRSAPHDSSHTCSASALRDRPAWSASRCSNFRLNSSAPSVFQRSTNAVQARSSDRGVTVADTVAGLLRVVLQRRNNSCISASPGEFTTALQSCSAQRSSTSSYVDSRSRSGACAAPRSAPAADYMLLPARKIQTESVHVSF
ncbi:hypothetical protein F441_17379 [Phytophthora nicotianae CJ01A1]|uniref:Uncharacterized protein n=2 Tax=Phytophthora nicotianae TaxID=4792 RepID=W2W6J7_PHYNI|nr:hypothetical protein L915_17046 [Phytophthora nicotianae]ETP06157.1 hypothetical protein F441_17379 [Phytophthora nicotianae CJ01A1]